MTPTLVVGIGNDERGDDGAGLEVARRLRARGLAHVTVGECRGSSLDLLESWAGRRRVILVDAASGSGPPGRVRRFAAHGHPLPAGLLHDSTHAWGVAEAVEMARALRRMPAVLLVYTIEGATFEIGRRLSRPVRRAIRQVERRILQDLGRPNEGARPAIDTSSRPRARYGRIL